MGESLSTLAKLWPGDLGQRTAVVIPDGGPILTYIQLEQQVASLAEMLAQGGIGKGDTVAIVLPNSLEFLATFLAVVSLRAQAAPLDQAHKFEEFKFYMKATGARAVVVPQAPHAACDAASDLRLPIWKASLQGQVRLEGMSTSGQAARNDGPPQPDDVALFLHTSGTTSHPKGVPLTHANLTTSIRNIAATYCLSPSDVSLVVMPMYHVHGLMAAVLSTLHTGGTVVIPQRFSASRFWPQVRTHRATWYTAVPTIHQILLARADEDEAPRGGLRFIRSCSASLAPAFQGRLEARFGAPVLQAYGMTEAAHQMTSNPLPPGQSRPGSVGPGTGVEIAILDAAGNRLPAGSCGEVCIRGPNVMSGYKDPAANDTAFVQGWFRTGDQGVLDSNGYLTLTGRLKEIINRGGEKISPPEVDNALMEHSAVCEAVCFGVPDPKFGEEIHAAVVLRGDVSEKELQAFCRDRLADYKIPKRVYFVASLPRTTTGKIQRRYVATHLEGKS